MTDRDPEDDPLVGASVGKYRISDRIGRGGMGAVYRAVNTEIGKRVALKFLDREAARDLDAVSRFQREAEAASAVDSAHIVQIFDSGRAPDGRPFLVMELLTGEDLRARLRREGRLALPVALRIADGVLRGLARAHEAGIVHRDLKPDNVFLCRRDDDPMFVKIVDFGISKVQRAEAAADTLTRRGTVLGTAFYMSPEQAQAFPDIDGRADLFSLGAILFEALAGRPPHTGSVYEAVLVALCTKDAPDVRSFAPEVPEAVARVIARALARDGAERFQSAEDFLAALAASATRAPRARAWALGLVAALVALALVALGLASAGAPDAPHAPTGPGTSAHSVAALAASAPSAAETSARAGTLPSSAPLPPSAASSPSAARPTPGRTAPRTRPEASAAHGPAPGGVASGLELDTSGP
ncbi:MAG: serine/threonine-protein kinase [Polyangiaceae bacterium]|nr:serine/threonine-protein kinase [Polyangiaceae bacterium]